MKQFTQRELLAEGFWDGFKKVAKGAGAAAVGAGRLIDIALPEVTKPLKSAISTYRDVSNAVKSAWSELKPFIEKVKKSLEEQGFQLDETQDPYKAGNKFLVYANEIVGVDRTTGKFTVDPSKKSVMFMVDKDGTAKKAPNISNKPNTPQPPSSSTPPPLPAPVTPSLSAAPSATPSTPPRSTPPSSTPPRSGPTGTRRP